MLRNISLILVILKLSNALCPDTQAVYPCICKDNSISCTNIKTEFDLREIFGKISSISNQDKNWKNIYIENTIIKELPSNVFGEISFEQIVLIKNPNLVYIHPLAFMRSSFTLKNFVVENTPLSNAGDKEIDIFDALSRCPDLETIRLVSTNLTSIPDNAFYPFNGDFNKLKYIYTEDSPIKTVGEFAFYYMPNLTRLVMTNNKFTEIKSNTFTIKDRSEEKSEIFLQGIPLTESSFATSSLTKIRRPLWIRLFYNNIKTLPESVFQPFLELYAYNLIDLSGNDILCDCRIKWILDDKDYYMKKIVGTDLYSCQLSNC